jgi:hypothetical protein
MQIFRFELPMNIVSIVLLLLIFSLGADSFGSFANNFDSVLAFERTSTRKLEFRSRTVARCPATCAIKQTAGTRSSIKLNQRSVIRRFFSWLADRFQLKPRSSKGTPKVGIFLDAENLAQFVKSDGGRKLIAYASDFGDPIIRRAYGDWSQPSLKPHQYILLQGGFQLVHTPHPVPKKNAADIAMVVDVMDILHRMDDLDYFVLATGDSDFSQLFCHLRQSGRKVIGVGPQSVLSEIVKSSTDRYIYIDRCPGSEHDNSTANQPVTASRGEAHALLERVLDGLPQEPIEAGRLKTHMLQRDTSFSHRALGHSRFTGFLEATGLVEFHSLLRGNCTMQMVVRKSWGQSMPNATIDLAGSDAAITTPRPAGANSAGRGEGAFG